MRRGVEHAVHAGPMVAKTREDRLQSAARRCGLEVAFRHDQFFRDPGPEPVLRRIYRMTEGRPKAEQEMQGPVTDEDAAVSARHVAKGLKERTANILAEDLPEDMAHLLAQLQEIPGA